MKLSDIKGQRSLDIIADAMELVDMMMDDERFKSLASSLKEARGEGGEVDMASARTAILRGFPPLLRDKLYQERIVSIMAAAAGVTAEEYAESGEVLRDILELMLTDSESLGFLIGSAAKTA